MKPIFEKVSYEANSSIRGVFGSGPVFTSPLHVHPELELVYVKKSYGKIFVAETVEDFYEGDLVLIGSGTPHFWKNDKYFYEMMEPDASQAYVIQFQDDIFTENLLSKSEFKNITNILLIAKYGIQILGERRKEILPLIQKIIETDGIKKLLYLFEILDLIGRTNELKLLNPTAKTEADLSLSSIKSKKLHNYLTTTYFDSMSLDEAADLVSMNKTSFCRYFKKQTGQTFIEFVNELRLKYASKLLADKSYTISQICFEVGFNNLSNFNRQFKRMFHKTPRQYAKENWHD